MTSINQIREKVARNKAEASGKEVAVSQEDPNQVPDWLQQETDANEDNFTSDDVIIPRVKLLQGLSGELEMHDHAKRGHFWHTGLDLDLGEEIRFIVCARRRKYLLTAPIADGQGILARADDAKTWNTLGKWQVKFKGVKNPVTWEIKDYDVEKSGLTKWGTQIPDDPDSPPAATLFYDYLVILPDHPELGPCVLTCQRSQIKQAKKGLNDKIMLHKQNGRPMQGIMFGAKSFDDSSDGQDFKNVIFTGKGFVRDKSLYDMAVGLKDLLSTAKIADETGDLSEGQSRGTGAPVNDDEVPF